MKNYTVADESTRYTLVHDRYHISGYADELLETAQTRDEAFRIARRCREIARGEGTSDAESQVRVFDVMARRGAVQLWDCDGQPLERRRSKEVAS